MDHQKRRAEIKNQVSKQIRDYDSKSPMKSRIEKIKQKLPFLGKMNLTEAQMQQVMNFDLNSLGPMSLENDHLRSTGGSFAERGFILKEVNPRVKPDELETPSATVDKLKLKKLLNSTASEVRRMN